MDQKAAYLATIPPFDRLPPEQLERVAARLDDVSFPPGGWLVRQGAVPEGGLLILTAGRASIIAAAEGEDRVVGECGPGDFAGLTGALTGEPHPVGVRADTAAACLRIPEDGLALCLAVPEFAAYFSRMLARRLRRTYREFTQEHDCRRVGVDAEPAFRRSVRELMRTPVFTCGPGLTVRELARFMQQQGLSAVVVTQGADPVGILTARDLVGKVLAAGLPVTAPVEAVMSAPVTTVPWDAPYTEALLTMVRGGFKHLPVTDPGGRLVGLVTMGDLVRARAEGALALVDALQQEQSIEGLAAMVTRIDELLRVMLAEGWQPSQILQMITGLNDRLARRILALGVERLGPPPVEWCWLHLGAAGREEQVRRTRQEHALVYARPEPGAGTYFADLARFVTEGLVACGFPVEPGAPLATEDAWRRPLADWQFWVLALPGRHGLEASLAAFLDFRPVAGHLHLAAALREQLHTAAGTVPGFLGRLAQPDLAARTDPAAVVTNLLRALALKHRLTETSTLGRLHGLVRHGALTKDEGDWLEIAYQTLLRVRLQEALSPNLPATLPVALRDALTAVARLQEWAASSLGLSQPR